MCTVLFPIFQRQKNIKRNVHRPGNIYACIVTVLSLFVLCVLHSAIVYDSNQVAETVAPEPVPRSLHIPEIRSHF